MATRRPKVPRVTPPAQQSAAGSAGGDVIQADFGGPRPAPATHDAGAGTAYGRGGGAKAAGSGAPAKPGAGAQSGSSAVAAEEGNLAPVPAKAFSGRMLALAVVMVAITIMLAPTVKIFIDKRAEIAALQSDIADSKADQDNLKRQVSRWQDPNYVKQQARDRINMVMPGETGYWVFGSDLPAGAAGSQPSAAETQDPADVPWVDSLWESIRRSATD